MLNKSRGQSHVRHCNPAGCVDSALSTTEAVCVIQRPEQVAALLQVESHSKETSMQQYRLGARSTACGHHVDCVQPCSVCKDRGRASIHTARSSG